MNRKFGIFLLIISFGAIFHNTALAEKTEETVESIAFEGILPEEPGRYDLRLSFEAEQFPVPEERSKKPEHFVAPLIQLFRGLTNRMSGEIGIPFSIHREQNSSEEKSRTHAGIGDVSLGFKYAIQKPQGHRFGWVGLVEINFPTGNEKLGLGEGKTETEASLGWIKTMSDFTAQGSVGYSLTNHEIERKLLTNLSVGYRLRESFFVLGECVGERNLTEKINRVYAGPAFKVYFTPDVSGSLGTLAGLTHESNAYRFITQIQYGWGPN